VGGARAAGALGRAELGWSLFNLFKLSLQEGLVILCQDLSLVGGFGLSAHRGRHFYCLLERIIWCDVMGEMVANTCIERWQEGRNLDP